jgi:hypothetical protein
VYSYSFRIQLPAQFKVKEETSENTPRTFTAQDLSYSDSSAHIHTMDPQGNSNSNPSPWTSHGGGGNVNPQVQNIPVDQNQQNTASQLAQQILNNTNVTLKQENITILEFYGQKGKATITAMDFITRVDECATSNNWNNITPFSNFHLYLCGSTVKWHMAAVRQMHLSPEQ